MPDLNETHDRGMRSWVESANAPGTDFPSQNLPYGVFSVESASPRAGVAIGDMILDLAVLEAAGLLRPDPAGPVFDRPELNPFMALGPAVWRNMRAALSRLLSGGDPRLRDDGGLLERALVPMAAARLHLPIFVRS